MLTYALGALCSQERKPCLTLALPVKIIFHPHLTGNPELGLRGPSVRWLTDVIKDQVLFIALCYFQCGLYLVSRWPHLDLAVFKGTEGPSLSVALSRGMVCFLVASQQTPLELGRLEWSQVAFPGGYFPGGKESTCQCRRCWRCRSDFWVKKVPWSRKWQLTPVFLPREFYGQSSLAGYSPWGHKESDMT